MLSWLMGEAAAAEVAAALERAEHVVASELTLLECERSLMRAQAAGALSELEMARRRAVLERSSLHWTLLKIEGDVLERARRRFPVEPVRTLDALHLASALLARSLARRPTRLAQRPTRLVQRPTPLGGRSRGTDNFRPYLRSFWEFATMN